MTQTKVGLDQIEKAVDKFDMTFLLVTGADDTYTVHESASFSYDIDKVFFATDTGAITFAVQVAPKAEVTRVAMPADATGWPASAAAAAHFLVRTVASTYYVWYSVAGLATDPAASGTGIEITGVASADLAASIATKTASSIGAFTFGSTSFSAVASADTVTLTQLQTGEVPDASDVDASVAITIEVTGSSGEVTGLGSLSVASAIQGSATPTALNDVQIGEDVKIVTASNASADMFRVTFHCSRN